MNSAADSHPAFDFTVDGEPFTTEEHVLTARQILDIAGVDTNSHYLVEIRGREQVEHKNLDDEIHMHEHAKFISVSTGPTPVS